MLGLSTFCVQEYILQVSFGASFTPFCVLLISGTLYVAVVSNVRQIEDRSNYILECGFRINGGKNNGLRSTDRRLFFNFPFSFCVLFRVYIVSKLLIGFSLNFIDTQ